MADFSGIKTEVENLKSVNASAIALINGIADRVAAAVAANDAGDNTELAGLADSIRGEASELAGAVTANTPAAGDTGGGTV